MPAVLIAWRTTDCPHRTKALAWTIARHAQNGWPVVIGRHDEGPWCKALAVADALAQTQAEILIVADADVWSDGIPEAVQAVAEGRPWAMPHRGVVRLSESSTALYAAGEDWPGLELDENAYLGVEGGGIVVIRRDIYESCPLDPRFLGWGDEDDSWGMALRTIHGPPHRSKTALVHLWHPPQQRASRSRGSQANRELRKTYAKALSSQGTMRALVADLLP